MISKAEWNQLDETEKYDYVVYMQGQIEGLIKSLRLVAPREKPQIVTPTEFKEVQSVEQYFSTKAGSGN